MTHVLGRRTVVKVNLEFARSRKALGTSLTLECRIIYIDEKVYGYHEIVHIRAECVCKSSYLVNGIRVSIGKRKSQLVKMCAYMLSR